MKKLISCIVICVIVLSSLCVNISVFAEEAVNKYYVDSKNGDDANDGLSAEKPWKSLQKVNSTVFKPGDKILFKRDGSWTGMLKPQGSGTEQAPIVIDMYGEGKNKPAVNGDGLYAVKLENVEYWELNNLQVTNFGPGKASRIGIYIYAKDMGSCDHIYIKNMDIHDVNGADANSQGGIVYYAEGTVKTKFNDLVIDGCTIKNVSKSGIGGWSVWSDRNANDKKGNWYGSTNVKITNNVLENIAGDGIVPFVCDAPLVENNVAINCGGLSKGDCVAMWPFNTDKAVFQYNEAYGTNGPGNDREGFDADYLSSGTIFQYNYSHDNQGGFILVCSNGYEGYQEGAIIRYNISQNDGGNAIRISGNTNNTMIYNNTIYIGKGLDTNPVNMGYWNGFPTKTYFYNNIFYNLGKGAFNINDSIKSVVFDYNLFYGNTPYEPKDAHKIKKDPMFVAPGTAGIGRNSVYGYKLKTGSPAIGKGKVIPGNGGKDYFGTPVSSVTAPDLGAITTTVFVAPKVPENLKVASKSDKTITVKWDDASAQGKYVAGYNVYVDNKLNGTTSGNTLTGITYTLKGLTPNKKYTIAVKSRDLAGNLSDASKELIAKTLPADNFIENASFETGDLEGWTGTYGDAKVINSDAADGSYSLKFHDGAPATWAHGLDQTILGLTPKTTYELKMSYKFSGPEGGLWFGIDSYKFNDGGKAWGPKPTEKYETVTHKFTTGPYQTTAHLWIWTGGENVTAHFDNMSIKVTDPEPDFVPVQGAVNDQITGTGDRQFNYVGTGWSPLGKKQPGAYYEDNMYTNTTDDYYTFKFTGTQLKLYMGKAPAHGIAGVSIDGGAEEMIDLYAADREDMSLVYTSPVLEKKEHIIKVRCTGKRNEKSSDNWVIADRIDVVD